MRGKVLRKNERIRWFVCSSNRDPERFVDPDKFDISRWPNAHVAFGSGIHHCLGAALARLEGQEVFKALARRYKSISLEIDEADYEPSIAHRSLKSLPVYLHQGFAHRSKGPIPRVSPLERKLRRYAYESLNSGTTYLPKSFMDFITMEESAIMATATIIGLSVGLDGPFSDWKQFFTRAPTSDSAII